MSDYLYVVRPTRPAMLTEGPTATEAAAVTRHLQHLRELARQGIVVLAGRTQTTDPGTFGLVVFRAGGEAAARAVVESDPAVAAGVMRAELYPYRIAVVGSPEAFRPVPTTQETPCTR